MYFSFGDRHWLCLKLVISVHGLSLAYTLGTGEKSQQYGCSNLSSKNEEMVHKIVLNIQ